MKLPIHTICIINHLPASTGKNVAVVTQQNKLTILLMLITLVFADIRKVAQLTLTAGQQIGPKTLQTTGMFAPVARKRTAMQPTNMRMPVIQIAIFAALSGLATLLGGRFFKKKSLRQGGTVEIEYRGRRASLNCICDSGNLLREPISQAPCILVELDALRGLFSDSFLRAVGNGRIEELSPLESSRIRMIPAQSASGDTLLVGIRPDFVRLDMGKGDTAVEAYIAFSVEKISAHGAKALVPSELVIGAA
jgi:hypothetical protein